MAGDSLSRSASAFVFQIATSRFATPLALLLVITAACSAATESDPFAKRGRWGSAQAILTTTDTGALLEIDAGGCIGSYGEIPQPIPAGAFELQGTHTQLMGVYPGMVVHPAQFAGTATDETVVVTITIPSAQRALGPFTLTYGVGDARSRCLYP